MCLALLITAITAVVTISFELLVNLLFILDKNRKYYGLTGVEILVAFSPLIVSTYFVLNFKYVSTTGVKLLLYIFGFNGSVISPNWINLFLHLLRFLGGRYM